MTDTVRILRVIEYTGPREEVELAISQRGVKGERLLPRHGTVIREAVLGETVEIISKGIEERDALQNNIGLWCEAAFGRDQARSLPQRGARLLEEAIEMAQAVGTPKDMAHKLVDFIYDRPPGEVFQEAGGVSITLLALCVAAKISARDAEITEYTRIMAMPIEHFQKRNQAKNDAGFYALSSPEQKADQVRDNG